MGYLSQTLIMLILMELFLFIMPYLSKRLDHLITGTFSFIFLLIITFRPFSVPDTSAYYRFFNQLESYRFSFEFGRTFLGFENGFCNFSKLIYIIYPNFHFFLFVIGSTSLILNFSALLRISNKLFNVEGNIWFPLFVLYIPYFGFLYSGIVLRAGIAIGFCLYSFYFLLKENIIRSIVLFGFGLWFHNSAFIFIVMYILFYIPKIFTNKQVFKLSVIILVLYLSRVFDLFTTIVLNIFNHLTNNISFLNFINHYVDDTINTTFRWAIVYILLLFVFTSFIYSQSSSKILNKYQNILLPLMVIIALLGGFPVILRGSDYYLILLFPLISKYVSGNNRREVITARFAFFSSYDRLFLVLLNILISVVFYFLFLRTASFI